MSRNVAVTISSLVAEAFVGGGFPGARTTGRSPGVGQRLGDPGATTKNPDARRAPRRDPRGRNDCRGTRDTARRLRGGRRFESRRRRTRTRIVRPAGDDAARRRERTLAVKPTGNGGREAEEHPGDLRDGYGVGIHRGDRVRGREVARWVPHRDGDDLGRSGSGRGSIRSRLRVDGDARIPEDDRGGSRAGGGDVGGAAGGIGDEGGGGGR